MINEVVVEVEVVAVLEFAVYDFEQQLVTGEYYVLNQPIAYLLYSDVVDDLFGFHEIVVWNDAFDWDAFVMMQLDQTNAPEAFDLNDFGIVGRDVSVIAVLIVAALLNDVKQTQGFVNVDYTWAGPYQVRSLHVDPTYYFDVEYSLDIHHMAESVLFGFVFQDT